jgi:hypothetical protein
MYAFGMYSKKKNSIERKRVKPHDLTLFQSLVTGNVTRAA